MFIFKLVIRVCKNCIKDPTLFSNVKRHRCSPAFGIIFAFNGRTKYNFKKFHALHKFSGRTHYPDAWLSPLTPNLSSWSHFGLPGLPHHQSSQLLSFSLSLYPQRGLATLFLILRGNAVLCNRLHQMFGGNKDESRCRLRNNSEFDTQHQCSWISLVSWHAFPACCLATCYNKNWTIRCVRIKSSSLLQDEFCVPSQSQDPWGPDSHDVTLKETVQEQRDTSISNCICWRIWEAFGPKPTEPFSSPLLFHLLSLFQSLSLSKIPYSQFSSISLPNVQPKWIFNISLFLLTLYCVHQFSLSGFLEFVCLPSSSIQGYREKPWEFWPSSKNLPPLRR